MKRCPNPNCDSTFLYSNEKTICPFCHSPLVENADGAIHAAAGNHAAKITANPYNTPILARNITAMLMDLNISAGKATKICLLGEILQKSGHVQK